MTFMNQFGTMMKYLPSQIPKSHIGRWLGQAYNVGQAMCDWISPPSGIPIARVLCCRYHLKTKYQKK
jgi:hypothetical protein